MKAPKDEARSVAEPIAIIGMGCRFPGGADDPERFWDMLHRGIDGIRRVPEGRWTNARYEECEFPEHLRYGGYLEQIDGFDAAFFGIAPRDALNIDPQQRLLLEVTWEALWDAGIEPAKISGQPVGVFAGIGNSDYLRIALSRVTESRAPNGINCIHSVAAGRISFLLNVTGPCIALDTACSSSLVTTHLACQSLRARECDLAISGGVSLKPLPDEMLTLNRLRAISKSSRCRTFDVKADGFVVGEGCGMIVLKRLEDAVRDGDRIRAVIRGTAVNHDGRTAVLTSPSAAAQESVMRQALRNAGMDAAQVSFVETHGTATPKNEPIELEALHAIYGAATESGEPCVLGAVKSNLGHLEAAAGVAGLVKVILAMEHGAIPKNLHFTRPNPEHWVEGTRLKVAEQEMPWPRCDRPRVAAVSALGLGGTNAHVIIEEAPVMRSGIATVAEPYSSPLQPHVWQRTRYWLSEAETSTQSNVVADPNENALKGVLITSPFLNAEIVEFHLDSTSAVLLREVVLPGGPVVAQRGLLELVRIAAGHIFPESGPEILSITLVETLQLNVPVKIQVAFSRDQVQVVSESATGAGAAWTTHLTANYRLSSTHQVPTVSGEIVEAVRVNGTLDDMRAELPAFNRRLLAEQFEQLVRSRAAESMGISEESLPVDVPLIHLGMDSMMAVDLKQQLEAIIREELPSNLAFEHPSVADIARVMASLLWSTRAGADALMASGLAEEVEI